jgi:predicted dehydrogenase
MKKIRVGLIGGGFIGRIHAEALRRLGYVDVVALAEANQKIADRLGEELSIPEAYGDWHDLMEKADVDSVHVLTPNRFHYPMSKAALEAGKHVLTEKPLAMNSRETAELVSLAKKGDRMHCLCHNMRYYPLVKQAREMVRRGEVGDIRLIHGQYLQDWLFLETDYNWRLLASEGGSSRAVADIGTHWFDMVQHITGQKVTSVFADMTTFIPVRKKMKVEVATFTYQDFKPEDYEEVAIDTEDHGTVLLKFSGGAKGVFVACQVCAGRKNHIHFEINGTKCTLEWCGEKPNFMWIGRRGEVNGEFIKNPAIMAHEAAKYCGAPCGLGEGYLDTFKHIFSDFYTWVREGRKMDIETAPFPTYQTGHEELSIVDAVLESRKTGKWEQVRY